MYLFGRKLNLRIIIKLYIQKNGVKNFGSKKNSNGKIVKLPPEPTNCCMSGCANCVWVEYAENLTRLFHGHDDKIKQLILDKITDPNMRAFLEMELRIMQSLKKNTENDEKK